MTEQTDAEWFDEQLKDAQGGIDYWTNAIDDVDEMLGDADAWVQHDNPTEARNKLRDARQELQETTAQLRADYGKMARARDAAVELLERFRDQDLGDLEHCVTFSATTGGSIVRLSSKECQRITKVIALLRGEDDEAE